MIQKFKNIFFNKIFIFVLGMLFCILVYILFFSSGKKTYTIKLEANGASVLKKFISCTTDKEQCEVILPDIITDGKVVGWSFDKNATVAAYKVGQSISVNENMTLYAITKKTFTATFENIDLSMLESNLLTCDVYNTETSCDIMLPEFNKLGSFNEFWSEDRVVISDMHGIQWDWKYFNQVGHLYTLKNDVTMYPNFNHFHYDLEFNYCKYRDFSVSTTKVVGKTLFEFENGIPLDGINDFIEEMESAYKVVPWLFLSGKVFVMTEETYNEHSIAYGLTHNMYGSYGGNSHFTIDLQYDVSGLVVNEAIDVNAALHELAHAWDSYYNFRTGEGNISSLSDFHSFYRSIEPKLYVDENGEKISKVETFAGMVTNYYWHVLGKDNFKSYYALNYSDILSEEELKSLEKLIIKYRNISMNDYK